jgi:hypothetical protein
MFKKYFIITAGAITACLGVTAQSAAVRDSAKRELLGINKVFDSSAYLGFDVHIQYRTDTSAGKFYHYEKNAVYYLNNRNYFYRADEMEYMQNDSFAVSVDNKEKTMLLAKNAAVPPGAMLLKDFIDNIMDAYATSYTVSLKNIDSSLRRISFTLTGNPSAVSAYQSFSLLYDTQTNYPQQMDIELTQKLPLNLPPGSTQVQPAPLTQYLSIHFSGFRGLPGTRIFDAGNYFTYNRSTGRYSPAEQYQYYSLLLAGIEEAAAPYNPGQLNEPHQ